MRLSMHVFETRTATGSERFSLLTCLHTTTFALPSIFSPLEMLGIKIWKTPLSWHARCPLPVVVRVTKSTTTVNVHIRESLLDNWLKNNHITVDIIYYLRNLLYLLFFASLSFQTYIAFILERAKTLRHQKNLTRTAFNKI